MEDRLDATELLHNGDDADLHFRFLGVAKGREFVVNVQFSSPHTETGERLNPVEYDFLIAKILRLVTDQIGTRPNPGLH
jgi:hypothetical protein